MGEWMDGQTAPVVFHSSCENGLQGLGLRDAIQPGFLSYQVDDALSWDSTSTWWDRKPAWIASFEDLAWTPPP